MKIIKGLLFCVLSCFVMLSARQKQAVFYGATSLHDMTLPSLDVSGAFKGKKLVIEKDADIKGSCLFKKSSVQHLTVKGSLSMKDMRVEQLSVRGSCKAEQLSVAKNCEMHGAVHFNKAFISGKTTISGACEMVDSSLRDLEWTGEQLILKDTKVKNILVKKITSAKVQKVILEGKTVVDGSITFEAKNGEVDAEKTVEIKGKIIRGSQASVGKIKNKNKEKAKKEGKEVEREVDEEESFFAPISEWFSEVGEWVSDLWKKLF